MSRNDLCFCGSGLKIKKCHADIHPNSRAARLIQVFKELDDRIHRHYEGQEIKPPCKPGCTECCHQYFPVSLTEYGMILYEMREWSEEEKDRVLEKARIYTEKFMTNYPQIYDYLEQDSTGDTDILKMVKNLPDEHKLPCIFLEDDSGKCKVYNVRPVICRVHGISHYTKYGDNEICTVIGLESSAKSWMPDFTCIIDNQQYKFESVYIPSLNQLIKEKEYPLFYIMYFDHYVHKRNYSIPRFEEYFASPESLLAEKYLKIIAQKMAYRRFR